MDAKKIKPIPKYIQEKILKLDEKEYPNEKKLRFFAYFTMLDKELVKITVAIKNRNKKVRLIKQVAIHGVKSENGLVKDMEYNYMFGYRVGWYEEGYKYPNNIRPYYNDGIWYSVPNKYYNPYAIIVNPEFAKKIYPYSAVDLYGNYKMNLYLRTYLKYPQCEYLVKLGLSRFVSSKQILEKIGTDKSFCRWLIKNKPKLLSKYYYIPVILRAYKTGKQLDYLQTYEQAKLSIRSDTSLKELRTYFRKDLQRFIDYITVQNTNANSYNDYFKACTYLGLDMTQDKNRYPHDFRRWHDIRIDEFKTKKAEKDAKAKAELFKKFADVAKKYLPLQKENGRQFITIIARSPNDLIREGELLHHCVGRMNYDQRFIREESLIFFIRTKNEPDTPLVTIEYSISQKRILQCYGDKDSRPNDTIMQFVNKTWLPFANRQLNKIIKQAQVA